MLRLPNNCRATEPTVYPKNWKRKEAMQKTWRVWYRFYDPAYPAPKLVKLMGMNKWKEHAQRMAVTELLLKDELQNLKAGYNPFIKDTPGSNDYIIDPFTPLMPALFKALELNGAAPPTKKDITNTLNSIQKAASQLRFSMPVSEVRQRHVIMLIEKCRENGKRFTDNTFNAYLKYLSILFNELCTIEAVEFNPCDKIPKKRVAVKERAVLTPAERQKVDDWLAQHQPAFHRFVHIFFHSGARVRELMRLKVGEVNLSAQTYKTVIEKRQTPTPVHRTIKNIALPLWEAQLQGASKEHYVFSKGLLPGESPINADQVTKRWTRLKKQLGITANFYHLKHLATTELVNELGNIDAAAHSGHTTTKMVDKIYDLDKAKRQHERIKNVGSKFA